MWGSEDVLEDDAEESDDREGFSVGGVSDQVGSTRGGAGGCEDLGIEIVILIRLLAASAKNKGSSELSILIWFGTIIIISCISSATKDLDKLVCKSVNLERAREAVLSADV